MFASSYCRVRRRSGSCGETHLVREIFLESASRVPASGFTAEEEEATKRSLGSVVRMLCNSLQGEQSW